MNKRKIISGQDLAFIIPTKDRPHKMKALLNSIARQSVQCRRIIIIDGGKSIATVVDEFRKFLPVEYYSCLPPGQIRQRNMGISKLDSRTELVGCIDDDMIFEPDAIEEMINFWNRVEINTAGVGFNLINTPPYRSSFILRFFLMSSKKQGSILPSGYAIPIRNIASDIRSQWLGGGYTIWKQEFLIRKPQDKLDTKWATGEDLRFSYPIGKKYPLYVCSTAKISHDHDYDQVPDRTIHRYIGRKGSLGYYYFVSAHEEFSKIACLWMLFGKALLSFVRGCGTLSSHKLEQSIGQAEAFLICLRALFGHAEIRSELED